MLAYNMEACKTEMVIEIFKTIPLCQIKFKLESFCLED